MNEFHTVIDYGTKNLRLNVFNETFKSIYSSKVENSELVENKNLEKSLIKLIRDAEKYLSNHIDYVDILYDTSQFNYIDLSIKKSFDQNINIKKIYKNLIEEASFIIKENHFKDQVIHIIINNIIIDEDKKIEIITEDIKIKSIILEIKFICLSKSLINDVSETFKKNNLNISNVYCSSYVKSCFYKKNFKNEKNLIFLDIGFQRSSAWFFINDKLNNLSSVPIGGNNITKDISKILKLSINYSENLKINFNKQIFDTYKTGKNSLDNLNLYKEIFEKNISIDLLKKIIHSRVEEIIELTVYKNSFFQKSNLLEKPVLIFIGSGAKLLSNTYNFNAKNTFSELVFFDENDSMICEAGLSYKMSDEGSLTLAKNKSKKTGIFERFFNLFSK